MYVIYEEASSSVKDLFVSYVCGFDDPIIYYNNCLFHFKTKLEITPTRYYFLLLLFHFKVDCCFKDLFCCLVLTLIYIKSSHRQKWKNEWCWMAMKFLYFYSKDTSVRKKFNQWKKSKNFYFFKCVDKIKIELDTLPTYMRVFIINNTLQWKQKWSFMFMSLPVLLLSLTLSLSL